MEILKILLFCLSSSFLFSQNSSKDTTKTHLNEITISKNPISEKFSVIKIEKLDIYFNPVSNADPLKAINILPSSTNVSESAAPTLRGGDADRTRVYLNGAPVLNPVRNGQDNGLSNFSLFNTELIDKQYVYASNPPLSYGNSSAGIVEIETSKELDNENIQMSLGLSNVGFLFNKKLSTKNFIQVYSNYSFSDIFLKLNKKNLPNLKNFSIKDIGINEHIDINKNLVFNSYNYFINEKYTNQTPQLAFLETSNAGQKRYFSINNLDYTSGRSKFRISTLIDFSNQNYDYGVIVYKNNSSQLFTTLNHKYKLNSQFTVQYGVDLSATKYNHEGTAPLYFYSLNSNSPAFSFTQKKEFNYVEYYGYANYELNSDFGVSGAVRKNIPFENQSSFNSFQFSSHYEINKRNRFIFSLGNYHSYSIPNYYDYTVRQLSSKQLALDYYYTTKKISFSGAVYFKNDDGDRITSLYVNINKTKTFGNELSISYTPTRRISVGLSNTFLHQKIISKNQEYNSDLNLKYLVKAQITYNNPVLFTTSLAFSARPGNFYTKVENALFDTNALAFAPKFGQLNNSALDNYSKLDFNVNKLISLNDKIGLIAFFSVNNVLNSKNQSSVYYNQDYSSFFYNYYQQRIFYFGVQFRFY